MKKSRIIIAFILILTLVFTQAAPVYAATTTVKAPTLQSVAYDEDDNCVILNWTKVSGVSGYQIYRSENKDGKYKKVGTASSSKTKYVDAGMADGKTYFYKIRAYKTVDGKKKYSKYSSRKSTIVFAETENLDFNMLLKAATEKHAEEQLTSTSYDGFTDYLVSGPEYQNLLTQEEIDALRNLEREYPNTITYKPAKEDVELFFRTLKYTYGAYFYFGGEEKFDKAQQEVMKKLKGKNKIDIMHLRLILRDALAFVKDAHFQIAGLGINEKYKYEYFYSDKFFSKDDKGFYKQVDGKKWYYKSCTNKNASIEPTLTKNGDLKYSLVLFCPKGKTDLHDSITLKCDYQNMGMSIHWTQQEALKNSSLKQEFVFEEAGGISYISIRNFLNYNDQEIYKQYEETAFQVKDSKLIIYDLRANGGGWSKYGINWVKNFTGTEPKVNSIRSDRYTALDENRYMPQGSEKYAYEKSNGLVLENNIPIILLVDDMCGSAGEDTIRHIKSMKNVIVIGSNSGGYQLCGNVGTYSLPNSNLFVSIPVSLQFNYEMKNIDGKGYEPDIWCNPKDALNAAYNFIINEGLADEQTLNELAAKVEAATPANITIKWRQYNVSEDEGFGTRDFNDIVTVCNNGKKITDYKVTFEDPSCGTATKKSDGTLKLKSKKRGQWNMYIEYKGVKHRFSWATY